MLINKSGEGYSIPNYLIEALDNYCKSTDGLPPTCLPEGKWKSLIKKTGKAVKKASKASKKREKTKTLIEHFTQRSALLEALPFKLQGRSGVVYIDEFTDMCIARGHTDTSSVIFRQHIGSNRPTDYPVDIVRADGEYRYRQNPKTLNWARKNVSPSIVAWRLSV